MRLLSASIVLCATPAYAHHEVVVAASILPLAGGLAAIAAAGLVALRKWLRNR